MVPLRVTSNASSKDAIIRSVRIIATKRHISHKTETQFVLLRFFVASVTFLQEANNVKSRHCRAAQRGQVDLIQRAHGAVVRAGGKLSFRNDRTERRCGFSTGRASGTARATGEDGEDRTGHRRVSRYRGTRSRRVERRGPGKSVSREHQGNRYGRAGGALF